MNAWIKKITMPLALILVCAIALGACTQSPAPETQPAPESPAPAETATLIPAPSPDAPEETPEPAPETPPSWPVNEDIGLSVTAWNESISEDGKLYLTAEVSMPAFSGTADAITGYYAERLDEFQRSAPVWAEAAKEMSQYGLLARPFTYRQNFIVECNAARIISVRRVEEVDLGGMHTETLLYYDNFLADTGQILQLSDFFTVPFDEYLPVLREAVWRQLEGRQNDLFEDWRETTESHLTTFPGSFCVSPAGLSLFYPELSIAPYVMGVVRVDIPWEDFEGIWTFPK